MARKEFNIYFEGHKAVVDIGSFFSLEEVNHGYPYPVVIGKRWRAEILIGVWVLREFVQYYTDTKRCVIKEWPLEIRL